MWEFVSNFLLWILAQYNIGMKVVMMFPQKDTNSLKQFPLYYHCPYFNLKQSFK